MNCCWSHVEILFFWYVGTDQQETPTADLASGIQSLPAPAHSFPRALLIFPRRGAGGRLDGGQGPLPPRSSVRVGVMLSHGMFSYNPEVVSWFRVALQFPVRFPFGFPLVTPCHPKSGSSRILKKNTEGPRDRGFKTA